MSKSICCVKWKYTNKFPANNLLTDIGWSHATLWKIFTILYHRGVGKMVIMITSGHYNVRPERVQGLMYLSCTLSFQVRFPAPHMVPQGYEKWSLCTDREVNPEHFGYGLSPLHQIPILLSTWEKCRVIKFAHHIAEVFT